MAHATTPLVEQLELLLLLHKLLLRVMHLLDQLPVVRCVLEAVGGGNELVASFETMSPNLSA